MTTLAGLAKLDGSIPAQAQLVPGEVLHASQAGVGLYDGGTKSPAHQAGSAHVTSHRLLYLDDAQPESCSLALNLSAVAQSDYYGGFLTSSSKVELVLHGEASSGDDEPDEPWTCPICAQDNQPSLGARRTTCSLCGASRPPAAPPRSSTATPANELQCTVCTFINEPGSTKCDMCDTPLPLRAPSQPQPRPERQTLKISFRKGGDKQFYAALKRALQAKAWKTPEGASMPAPQHGISGIMNAVETSANQSTDTVASALRDLEALAAQAKSMVALASNLSARLQQSQSKLSAADAEASSFIQKSLYNMGLALPDGPVMQDSLNNEKKWTDELAGEVAGLLREGLMGGRGMVGLDEIWCAWNRARGVALISPETFLAALTRAVEKRQVDLALRTLKSGLIVLHAPRLSHGAFCARLLIADDSSTPAQGQELRGESDPEQRWHTPLDVAAREEIAVALAALLLEAAEDDGLLWRDVEPFGGVRWTANVLKDWTWDGSE
ncbi:hypothetical protein AURDEDRAFT_114644 [Auricularia subglabra TFB-10046 SS5]|nr:hypothetical protein AURDEDRAFT_114644 [Auricularia subglabra TFB-10046 SS5]